MKTLQQILQDSSSYLDLDSSLPESTELTIRVNFANQAVWDAADILKLKEFNKMYETTISGATVSLPQNFRSFSSWPRIYNSVTAQWDEYPEITPDEKYSKNTDDKYCYVLGNPAEGYSAVFNGYTAGQQLSFVYQRYPSGMATLSDKCELSDPQFVVLKLEAYVLQTRNNPQFPYINSQAETKLQNMAANNQKVTGGSNNLKRIGASAYSVDV